MNYKSLFLSAIGGAIFFVIIDGVWYSVLMKTFYESIIVNPYCWYQHPNVIGIVCGEILLAFVMAIIYQRWSQGNHTLTSGFILGALIGILIYPILDLLFASQFMFQTMKGMIVDSIYGIIAYGLVGAVIAWICKMVSPK